MRAVPEATDDKEFYTIRVRASREELGWSHGEVTANVEELFKGNGLTDIEVCGAVNDGISPALMYWACQYATGREYGGPEEGGWYFDVGGLERAEGFFTRREATKRLDEWEASEDYDPETGSRLWIEELPYADEPVESYPDRRPHYE